MKVSQDAQRIFDQIHFVFDSEWDDDSIIINKAYVIKAPYEKVEALSTNNINEGYMSRLVKALEKARRVGATSPTK